MGIRRIVGILVMSQTTPMGEVNPHYRLLRKQYKSLKGSLKKAVKYMKCVVEPAPSLGAVGYTRAAPDAPEASLQLDAAVT